MKALTVALVGPLPPPSGGMANQSIQMRQLLESAGIEVRFARVNEPYRPAVLARVKGVRAVVRLIAYVASIWRMFAAVDVVHVMANSGWSWHLFAAPAIWVARMRSKPVVVNYRGGEAEKFFRREWRWVRPTLARADAVVVPSPFLEQVFAQRGIRCSIVPNVLDMERFAPPAVRRDFGNSPHVVVTRNLEKIYDVPTAIRAFEAVSREYPGARLTIAGSGPEEAALKALVTAMNLDDRVSFSGRLSNEEVAALYRRADLMLNASLEDNSPNSLIEALACGVPVVSTSAGGIPLLVRDGVSAVLVPVLDHVALGAAAVEVLADAELRRNMVREGLELARKFEKTRVLGLWQAEYAKLLSPAPVHEPRHRASRRS